MEQNLPSHGERVMSLDFFEFNFSKICFEREEQDRKVEEERTCAICLDLLISSTSCLEFHSSTTTLLCGHQFHTSCVQRLPIKKCPFCKKPFVTEAVYSIKVPTSWRPRERFSFEIRFNSASRELQPPAGTNAGDVIRMNLGNREIPLHEFVQNIPLCGQLQQSIMASNDAG